MCGNARASGMLGHLIGSKSLIIAFHFWAAYSVSYWLNMTESLEKQVAKYNISFFGNDIPFILCRKLTQHLSWIKSVKQ